MRVSIPVTKPVYLKIAVLAIILVAGLLAFHEILALPFTGTDTLTLIDTGRVASLKDVVRILSQPMMAGTTFVENLTYYRPVSVLSISMDYMIWGMNPWGYHLTDLLLHLASTLLFFLFLERVSEGRTWFACLAALLFTLHPLLSQSLPVISRRQDLLATVFSLLAILLFIRADATRRGRRFLLQSISVLFCILAMGSKETGFLTPFFILTYVWVFQDTNAGLPARIVDALRNSAAYLLAAVLYLLFRTGVLGGLGFSPFGSRPPTLGASIGIALDYFNSLVDPGDAIYNLLKAVFPPDPGALHTMGSAVLLALLFVVLRRVVPASRAWVASQPNTISRNSTRFLLVVIMLAVLVLVSYSLLAPVLSKIIQDAYDGRGLPFIIDAMQGRATTPVESYLLRARNYAIGPSYLVLIYGLLTLGWLDSFASWDEPAPGTWARVILLLTLWLWLPLGLFIFTASASQRSMYFSVALFSAILSAILVRGISVLAPRMMRAGQPDVVRVSTVPRILHIGTVGLVAIVALAQIVHGPLFKPFTKWEQNGRFSSEFFNALDQELPGLPKDAHLTIYGLPSVTESSIMDYTVKSWLELNLPGNTMRVVIADRVDHAGCESCLRLRIEHRAEVRYDVFVEFLVEAET